ncbi:MAG: phosphomannomutase/phosphoglucomutase [Propionibacteriaceae bacterium]
MISPQIFKANEIRGVVAGEDPEWDAVGARELGAAWVDTLDLTAGAGSLVLGHDMRTTSPELSTALAVGATSRGVDVIDIGLASTDQLWFASGRLDLPGVMFTASHNPGDYNGIKFCHAKARPLTTAILAELKDRVINPGPAPVGCHPGSVVVQDLLPAYVDHLLSLVDLSTSRRLRVVADAGNGMAGHTLPSVFAHLDAELIGLYLELDGSFPNHPPNPLEPQNLVDAQRAVRQNHADLGLVFDGDADRCFIIDERGQVVSPSAVTALIATQELAREPGATIVRNLITSRSVPEIVAERGGTVVTTRVGHTFVKAAMAEHDAIFGGEHSAHYYFRDFWGADTGMLAALHVLAVAGRSTAPLSELVAEFTRYAASGEINSAVADADAAMAAAEHAFTGRGTTDRTDGLTITGADWWFNLRASNTEPLLRLNVEAVQESTMASIRDEVLGVVRSPS